MPQWEVWHLLMLTKLLVCPLILQRAPQGQQWSHLGTATGVRGPAGGSLHGAKAPATALSFLPTTQMFETNAFCKALLETPLWEGISEKGVKLPQAGAAAGGLWGSLTGWLTFGNNKGTKMNQEFLLKQCWVVPLTFLKSSLATHNFSHSQQ